MLAGRRRVGSRREVMRVCLAAGLLVHSIVAQFGTIRIDWVSEGALGDGRATPHVGGLSAEVVGEEPAAPPAPSADTYEEAWWRDDFAHDLPGVWFGAGREVRNKRPAEMVQHALHVGAVYTHTLTGARGVVVGWDERARAPREWLVANLPGKRSWADQMRRLCVAPPSPGPPPNPNPSPAQAPPFCRYAPHYSVLEEIEKPDGSKHFMKRCAIAQCRERAMTRGRRSPPPPAHPPAHPPTRPNPGLDS